MKTRAEQRAYQREWRKRNPERIRAYNKRWRKYDPTVDRSEGTMRRRAHMRAIRGIPHAIPDVDQRCAICGIREDVSSQLQLDHDHTTGQFRGWLCGPCNRGLGQFRDDAERCNAAAAYLRAA